MLYQDMKFCCFCGGLVVPVSNTRKQCESCGQQYHPNPWPVVLVVAYEASGRVLLTRHKGLAEGTWKLIGGYVEDGETAEEAAVREARKECNVQIEVERLVRTYADPNLEGHLLIGLCARIVGGDLRAGSDVSEVGLFKPAEAPIPRGWPAYQLLQEAMGHGQLNNVRTTGRSIVME